MDSLRVLSYNIHKGFTGLGRKFVLEHIRESLHEVNPDLVFLQEVVGDNQKHRRRVRNYPHSSQVEYLARDKWPYFAYGRNAEYTNGHHGNALLSKFPIEQWNNLDISTSRWERRGLLHATLCLSPSERLEALSLHLDLFEGGRRKQIQQTCDYLKRFNSNRVILAGDFNDWRERISPSLRASLGLEEAYQAMHREQARSFPSICPALRLDRIYFRGFKAKQARCLDDKRWIGLSDHLPLYAEFEYEANLLAIHG